MNTFSCKIAFNSNNTGGIPILSKSTISKFTGIISGVVGAIVLICTLASGSTDMASNLIKILLGFGMPAFICGMFFPVWNAVAKARGMVVTSAIDGEFIVCNNDVCQFKTTDSAALMRAFESDMAFDTVEMSIREALSSYDKPIQDINPITVRASDVRCSFGSMEKYMNIAIIIKDVNFLRYVKEYNNL